MHRYVQNICEDDSTINKKRAFRFLLKQQLTFFSPSPFAIENIGESVYPNECDDYREDYFECLHHRKEAQRRQKIAEQAEIYKKAQEKAAEQAKVADATEQDKKPS